MTQNTTLRRFFAGQEEFCPAEKVYGGDDLAKLFKTERENYKRNCEFKGEREPLGTADSSVQIPIAILKFRKKN